jgi:hypothetical protein
MRVMRNLIVVLVTLLIAALAGCATSDRGQNPGAASDRKSTRLNSSHYL